MGIEVDIPNPENLLKPGMYARIDLVVEVRPTLSWCRSRFSPAEGQPTVMVVRDGKVASRSWSSDPPTARASRS